MRIGFFLQNNKQGGLDTFVLQLVQNWPNPDQLVLFCNESHPGLGYLRQNMPKSVKIISYDFLIFQDFDWRFKIYPSFFSRICKIVFWIVGFIYQVKVLKKRFSQIILDRLLVINGGYPAGDACLAATVAWGKLNRDQLAWHNFHNFVLPLPTSLLRRMKENWIDKQVANSIQGFVSVSQSCRDSLDNRPLFKNLRREFIYNGMMPLEIKHKSDLRSELSLVNETQIILMLGVYEPRKGHHFIINVMERVVSICTSAHLLICGDGNKEEVQVVEELRRQSKVSSHIHLSGHREITNLFQQTDLLVVPSQAYESFGYTALEAMSFKLPVVVTNIGGLPEVVKNEECGYIVDYKNVDDFANRIIKLLQDKSLRIQMGKNGYNRCNSHFTAKRMAQEYADIVR